MSFDAGFNREADCRPGASLVRRFHVVSLIEMIGSPECDIPEMLPPLHAVESYETRP